MSDFLTYFLIFGNKVFDFCLRENYLLKMSSELTKILTTHDSSLMSKKVAVSLWM